jgi:hypothetical protein
VGGDWSEMWRLAELSLQFCRHCSLRIKTLLPRSHAALGAFVADVSGWRSLPHFPLMLPPPLLLMLLLLLLLLPRL